jgi:hypothetical protein
MKETIAYTDCYYFIQSKLSAKYSILQVNVSIRGRKRPMHMLSSPQKFTPGYVQRHLFLVQTSPPPPPVRSRVGDYVARNSSNVNP